MKLETYLRERKATKDILLMTHIVLGYPSLSVNREVIRQMVDNGVDCIEMQLPFSEPMADGPVILKANQDAIAAGITIEECLAFGAEMSRTHTISFLYMTYFNIVYKYGESRFFDRLRDDGITGLILPDLPPEEGAAFCAAARERGISPVQIFAPTSTEERMRELHHHGAGFVYCAARRGVTGSHSQLDEAFDAYLQRCRSATPLPLAVGFGIQSRADVAALIGKADMAVVGSQTIKLVDERGVEAVGPFIASLTGTIS
ncbi:tryptophan synthase subunit alpha [Desulfofustis limnaeus]|jgi:tryptophan synthase alpha chain|uniref:Tryptophan synthase alpha chain n=1 Tax=Desulfofustis limnaeus TaxID=2740163 RepID=A0ABM7W9R2_9BACT|nr:tryptophan synthase subunit alpha [Desulfofustis limnaeus]MDX9894666.1 tryptophan synthase subunit alpha [Desulfofustis sp.]BDD87720.1 tryptophan synthase alpha chain [Desulfofustis limnaeus]